MFKKYRSQMVVAVDLMIIVISYYIALWMRFDFSIQRVVSHSGFLSSLVIVLIINYIIMKIFKTDKSIWHSISIDEGLRIGIVNVIATIIVGILKIAGVLLTIPRSVILIAFPLITLAQEALRFSYRIYRYMVLEIESSTNEDKSKRFIIYGAGQAGTIILRESLQNKDFFGRVIGFIDDDPNLAGKIILGKEVLGSGERLDEIVNRYRIDEIIVAMPSTNIQDQRKIMHKAYETGLPVKSVNSVESLMNGNPLKQVLKKVEIVDLLERKEIALNNEEIIKSIYNKDILVTGAAGSIGSELVRQIITYKPKSLTLIDINENGLYELQQEILMQVRDKVIDENLELNVYLSSIRDYGSLSGIFNAHRFNLVFHAAAHKHVPLMETSPEEAIKNNILGTKNLVKVAKKYNIDTFVNVSTDKAVNPTNVMGATKRFIEMIIQSQEPTIHTKFVAVRFGNVLGSNGSVVPLFRKQIEVGGPVTVTHPDIVRYFMTIPEAVSLILQAETYAKGGEIFVLDMGEPVKILDLAEKVITLSGYKPYEDIDIVFTGLRPGEKLYEELLMSEEGLEKTANNLIHVSKPIIYENGQIKRDLQRIEELLESDYSYKDLIDLLEDIVPTFKHEPHGIAIVR